MKTTESITWEEVETPQLVVDRDRMMANIEDFHRSVLTGGKNLRAHVKTHKSVDIAEIQIQQGAVGIAAAKLSEAEVFIEAGIRDVVIAYPIFGESKFAKAARLARECERFVVHVENTAAVEGLSSAAVRNDAAIGVRIEIDSGFHRTGVGVEGAVELGKTVESLPGVWLDGITTHRSMFFPGADGRPPEELGVLEGEFMVDVAERLRAEGMTVNQVVAGSTPTGKALATVDGVTEVCAGTYVFYDAGMSDLGVTERDSVALHAVTTVVVAHPGSDTYTVDAGAKTLTKDSYPGEGPKVYGRRADNEDVVVAVTDEHGIVRSGSRKPDLGDVVRIVPMHVCPTVNLTDELVVTSQGYVVDVWPVSARGKTK